MLNEKLGEVEYDGLIAGLNPKKRVGPGVAPASSRPTDRNLILLCGVGSDDFLYKEVVKNREYFDARGIRYQGITTPGGHTWMNARTYLSTTLQLLFQ